jgi:putative membrane protein
MTRRSVASAILVAVAVSVLLVGLVLAQQDQNTNSNMNQNTNMSGKKGSTNGQNTNAPTVSSSDRKFMMEAATAGMEEVELGRVAAARGSTDAVKQFGQRMVDDHSKANEELTQIASTKGVALPTALDEKHKADVAKMSGLSGAEFDRMYAKEAGVKDHEKAVKLFQREADQGKDAELKAFASKTLPTIQDHLRMAREMSGGMSTSGNKNASASSGNANMSDNTNMSGEGHKTNSDKKSKKNGNDNTSGTSNTNENSNTTNANGNSNTPPR